MFKNTNWKTTTAGIGSLLMALGEFLSGTYDNDPAEPNYALIVNAIVLGLGLIFAKDKDK